MLWIVPPDPTGSPQAAEQPAAEPESTSERASEPQPGAKKSSAWRDIADGLSATLKDSLLLPLVSQAAWSNLFQQAVVTLYLLYSVRSLHLSPGIIGLVVSIGGVGAFVASLVTTRIGRAIGAGPTIVASIIVSAAGMLLVPAAGGSKAVATIVLSLGFFIYGFGMAIYNIYSLSVRIASPRTTPSAG